MLFKFESPGGSGNAAHTNCFIESVYYNICMNSYVVKLHALTVMSCVYSHICYLS